MGLHETLNDQDLRRGAAALSDFLSNQGAGLSPQQQDLVVRAFDHGITALMEGPVVNRAASTLLL